MKKKTKTILQVLSLLITMGVSTSSTMADPLFFGNVLALQNGGVTQIDLFTNPNSILLGPQISFLVDITGVLPLGTTNVLSITYLEEGSLPIVQTYPIPLFGTLQPPFTLLFTITSPGASSQGVPATLTIDITGSSPDFIIPGGPNAGQQVNSYTFSFVTAQPIPEPTTITLMGIGLAGILAQRRLRRGK